MQFIDNKKQYTRKQIKEAIEFWTKQLQFLDEAQTAILTALENEFGKTLYSNEPFVPTSNVMNHVFDVLNTTLFGKQLPKLDVLCLPTSQMQHVFDKHHHNRNVSELHAVYFPLLDIDKIDSMHKSQIPKIHYLMINTSCDGHMNFAFAINSLCHEMIHYLDTIEGDVSFQWKTKYDNNDLDSFDEHKTKTFMEKQAQFNKDGLTIIPDDGNFTQKELNDFSLYRMKKLQEMEEHLLSTTHSKSHLVATDIGNGQFAISF